MVRCSFLLMLISITLAHGGEAATTKSPQSPTCRQQELRQELLAMMAADQEVRVALLKKLRDNGISLDDNGVLSLQNAKTALIMAAETWTMSQLDCRHRRRLQEIVQQFGWPGKSLVGKDGAKAAWLLVQHADNDPKFQKACLDLMTETPADEVEPIDIAYLTDRVLVNEKNKQVYGTQLDGAFKPRPIEDADNVDRRRAELGLPPLAEYVQAAKSEYEKLAKGLPSEANPQR